jgi:hypothetical protein
MVMAVKILAVRTSPRSSVLGTVQYTVCTYVHWYTALLVVQVANCQGVCEPCLPQWWVLGRSCGAGLTMLGCSVAQLESPHGTYHNISYPDIPP